MVTKALVPHATPEGYQTLKVSPSSLRPHYTPPSPLCLLFFQAEETLLLPNSSSPFKSQCGYPSWVPSPTNPLHSCTDTWVGSLSLEACFHILSHQNLQHFTYPSKKIITYEPLDEYVVFLLCTLLNNA